MGTWTPGPGATSGNDTFVGDGTNETAIGLDGNDTLHGNGGDDILYGDAGYVSPNPPITPFNDFLYGGDGNDRLYGGPGSDLLDGGAGDDILHGGIDGYTVSGGYDTFDGGSGIDRAEISISNTTDVIEISLPAGVFKANGISVGGLTNVENIYVYAGSGADILTGGALNDAFFAGGGDDIVDAGAGSDTLDGGTGNDTLSGGAGDDYFYASTGTDQIDGGSGSDTIGFGSSGIPSITLDLRLTTAQVTGYGTYTITGVENIYGGFSADTLHGDANANELSGNDGDDYIDGGDGDDLLMGGAGTDQLIGGLGDDSYSVDVNDTITEFSGEGIDTVLVQLSTYILGANIENLTFNGAGSFTGIGNGLSNIITGGPGADSLDGAGGDDTLISNVLFYVGMPAGDNSLDGGAGNDTADYAWANQSYVGGYADIDADLTRVSNQVFVTAAGSTLATDQLVNIENLVGGFGNDRLRGDANANSLTGGVGNDLFCGGAGSDILTGGDGNDFYLFRSADFATSATDTVNWGAGDTIRVEGVQNYQLAASNVGGKPSVDIGASHIVLENFGSGLLYVQSSDSLSSNLTAAAGAGLAGGSLTTLDWSNAYSWRAISETYNASLQRTNYDIWQDSGASQKYGYDLGNQFYYSSYYNGFDAANRQNEQGIFQDDGGKQIYLFDVAQQANWLLEYTIFDTAGAKSAYQLNMDSGASQTYFWDTKNQNGWDNYYAAYDTQNRMTFQSVKMDNGTSDNYGFDSGNLYSWKTYSEHFDDHGNRMNQITYNDDSSHLVIYVDPLNQQNWYQIHYQYNAANALVSQHTYYDDGSFV